MKIIHPSVTIGNVILSLALPVAVCIMKGFKDIRREMNAYILKLHNIEVRKKRAGREMWAITKVRIKQVDLRDLAKVNEVTDVVAD